MAALTPANNFCLKLQESFMPSDKNIAAHRDPLGFVESLLSNTNLPNGGSPARNAIQNNQKIIAAYENYRRRPYGASTVGTVPDLCADGTSNDLQTRQLVFDATDLVSTKFTLTESQWRLFCDPERPEDEVREYVDEYMQDHYRAMNLKLASDFQAARGAFPTDGTTAAKDLIGFTASGEVNPVRTNAFSNLLNEFEFANAPGRPIVVGGGLLRDYMSMVNFSAANTTVGFDPMASTSDVNYFYDRSISEVTGNADSMFTFAPGMVQPVTQNWFSRQFGNPSLDNQNGLTTIRTTFTDGDTFDNPVTLDLEIKHNGCTREDSGWTVVISGYHKLLFAVADDAFDGSGVDPITGAAESDPLSGVNFAMEFIMTQAV